MAPAALRKIDTSGDTSILIIPSFNYSFIFPSLHMYDYSSLFLPPLISNCLPFSLHLPFSFFLPLSIPSSLFTPLSSFSFSQHFITCILHCHFLSFLLLGVLFFLGILLSVGAMDSAGILRSLAEILDKNIPNDAIVASTYFTLFALCLSFIISFTTAPCCAVLHSAAPCRSALIIS